MARARNNVCPDCKAEYCNSKDLQAHIRGVHPGRNLAKLICGMGKCTKTFADQSNLRRHQKTCGAAQPAAEFYCTFCQGSTTGSRGFRKDNMNRHMEKCLHRKGAAVPSTPGIAATAVINKLAEAFRARQAATQAAPTAPVAQVAPAPVAPAAPAQVQNFNVGDVVIRPVSNLFNPAAPNMPHSEQPATEPASLQLDGPELTPAEIMAGWLSLQRPGPLLGTDAAFEMQLSRVLSLAYGHLLAGGPYATIEDQWGQATLAIDRYSGGTLPDVPLAARWQFVQEGRAAGIL
ncbi:hypothetical protein PMZ80_001095 [Knufia obscura]|uniref:C2H2-type domain-containing protein n=1 Tax=Knufia obscura TaxID=1635080 RepID=A0ABR0S280_9EURO|nr:hypothetical protein PMZ80_001095 [Knufia obscura]